MEIKTVILRYMKMRLLHPFQTSVGTEIDKDFILVEVKSEKGISGYGESVASIVPLFHEETVQTNWHMLQDYLIPALFKASIQHPDDVSKAFTHFRGNYNAKAAIEGAVWDLYAKEQNLPLATALGGTKKQIEVGVSIGIQESEAKLLQKIEGFLDAGFKRIKVKVMPGWDLDILRAVRRQFPDIQLMADANCAYSLKDIDHLRHFDEFGLTMIEQPLDHGDIIDHAQLQAQIETPICLDESIHSAEDARKAIELGSCKIINLKIGRVGGLTESKKIHDLCQQYQIPIWCGGMLEAGVGRAHNIAITSLPNFSLPGDTAPSAHYWDEDIILPEVTMHDGLIEVPTTPGIGFDLNWDKVEECMVHSRVFHRG
ncbi:o-succinylbenzoate synthase [Sporosarcina obsidiansis]|uniref:o-succinylbenzoate synthase n=1 Tax=Sporosarcina obsidiansis TaxID=2660748 RepID=UPI00129B77B4|nr:o-succinylbenzoate synthase [Sporosarcina obsidiansis]